MRKPNIAHQLLTQTGMGRPGGMASQTSTKVPATKGSGFVAMEAALLKAGKGKKTVGTPGKQFRKIATT